MIKVLVIDDEYFAREGMKKTIDWKSMGCQLVGEGENGIEGIELSKKLRPDIIITDIKMPGLDGIKMAEKIREFLPDCLFIILTGYDDFNYAKGAIKINAVDFILKPMEENEFLEALSKASLEYLKIQEGRTVSREKALLDIMRGKIVNKDTIEEIFRIHNIYGESLIIALVENDNYNVLEKDKEDIIYIQNRLITNIISENMKKNTYVVQCHQHRLAIIISAQEDFHEEELNRALRNIQKQVKESCKTSITIGISGIGRFYNLRYIYSESKTALENKFYKGKDTISAYNGICYSEEEHTIDINKILNELMKSLNAKDKRNTEKFIKCLYFDLFMQCKIKPRMVKEVSREIIISALKLLKEYNLPLAKVLNREFDVYDQISRFETLIEIYDTTMNVVISVLDSIKEVSIEAQESGIEKALEYIKEHYCEDISLSDVAKYSYLSESYLSRRIKKILGIGFSEYLTKLRVEKAKEYFKDPKIKITEVANKLGYPDYRYFSHIFKKTTGYSPSEYIKIK